MPSLPTPKDDAILAVFRERDGMPTVVVLASGKQLLAYDIAWGYDFEDEYAQELENGLY